MYKLALLLVVILSCSTDKEKSLEDLQTESWEPIEKGIYHLSSRKGKTSIEDSISWTVKGMSGKTLMLANLEMEILSEHIDKIIKPIIQKNTPGSKKGYLKIDIYELLKPRTRTVNIYLDERYKDSIAIANDLEELKSMNGIIAARYISKDEAKKEWFASGNQGWDSVLSENPLPASYEIIIGPVDDMGPWNEQFRSSIENKISGVSNYNLPTDHLDKKKNTFVFLKYEKS